MLLYWGAVLRQALKKHKEAKKSWRATHFVKKYFRDTVAEKDEFIATCSLVSSWKSLLGHKLLILCDGSALRPFGRWARAMGTGRLECAPEKTIRGTKAISLCMIQPFIISVFQNLGSDVFSGLRRFFRNPAEHFAGLRSGTFFAQRRIQVYIYIFRCFVLTETYFPCPHFLLHIQSSMCKIDRL